MKKLMIGLALAVLAFAPDPACAQSLPGSAQGVDMGAQGSRATIDATNQAARQAVEDARKDKARAQAEAEQKAQGDAKKAAEPMGEIRPPVR